jgi:uncharacterized membrane protein
VLAVTSYQIGLAFHTFAAVVWVGGALAVQIMALLALRSALPGRKAEFAGEAELFGIRVFMPASLVLLGLGFYLVYKGDWGYPLWVIFGLAGLGFSFLTGILYLTPQSKRIKQLLETQGPESAEAVERIRKTLLASRVELVVLVLLVFDMVLKPGQ